MARNLIRLLLAGSFVFALGVKPSAADTVTFNNSSLHPDGILTVGNTITLANGVIDAVARVLPLAGYNITGGCGDTPLYGCLSIQTGVFLGSDGSTTANDYNYSGVGSSIVIRGGIAALGLANDTILFQGMFDLTSNVILQFDDICQTAPGQCTGSLTGTLAPGLINPVLAAALGVSPNSVGGNDQNLYVNFQGISFPTSGFPSGTARGNTNQLQIVTPGATAVPEPASMLLFGSGLAMFAKAVRRYKK